MVSKILCKASLKVFQYLHIANWILQSVAQSWLCLRRVFIEDVSSLLFLFDFRDSDLSG